MKTLYLDCGMGAAGDMLAAALLELLPEGERSNFVEKMNSLGLPGVKVGAESAAKCGITGTHFSVSVGGTEEDGHLHEHHHEHEHEHKHEHEHHHEHHHSGMHDIEHIVGHMPVSPAVRENILAVYGLIGAAESHVHGVPVTEIHFHEVGTLDAVADVTAVCLLMDMLAPERVVASPVHVGSGTVVCAHGTLPVPAPATAYILQGVPIYGGSIKSELCTPTGAALLKHFVTEFGDMPVMRTGAIGYGMGKKDFDTANCVRALLGETDGAEDIVYELSCNVDDMTAEEISFATERLFAAGALEVYTIAIGMKKSRPGTLIRAMCREEKREDVARAMFANTTTIGLREAKSRRRVLDRTEQTLDTPLGAVRVKRTGGYGVSREKFEYDDLARIAREKNMSIYEVRAMLEKG